MHFGKVGSPPTCAEVDAGDSAQQWRCAGELCWKQKKMAWFLGEAKENVAED